MEQNRRNFLKTSAVAASAAAISGPYILAQPAGTTRTFKVALIGSGGRGSGALNDHHQAAKNLNQKLGWNLTIQVVAIADWSENRARGAGQRYGLAPQKCFGGPDGYKKVLAENPDIILMAQPPLFRPLHFEAAITAGKHVFFEKPVAVDPVGVRRVIKAGEMAKAKKLCVVAGTQRRHSQGYNNTYREILDGARGKVMAGRVSWCMGAIFSNTPINPKGPDDIVGGGKWQLWVEGSGDHICEQHVHNIDIANWYIGAPPVSAVGFGHRARRVAGNMYDFFSVDFEYPNGVYVHSMCRQVGKAYEWVGEQFTYEKRRPSGYKPEAPDPYAEPGYDGGDYVAEHAHLLWAIVRGKELNEAKNVAESTGAAILGRESAYSGKKITWAEMYTDPNKNPKWHNLALKPAPEDFETGQVELPKDGDIRVPGTYMA